MEHEMALPTALWFAYASVSLFCIKFDGEMRDFISRNSLSFQLQKLPQTIHCLHYAPVNHRVTSRDLDVAPRALPQKR
jgi:hypothetical protein